MFNIFFFCKSTHSIIIYKSLFNVCGVIFPTQSSMISIDTIKSHKLLFRVNKKLQKKKNNK